MFTTATLLEGLGFQPGTAHSIGDRGITRPVQDLLSHLGLQGVDPTEFTRGKTKTAHLATGLDETQKVLCWFEIPKLRHFSTRFSIDTATAKVYEEMTFGRLFQRASSVFVPIDRACYVESGERHLIFTVSEFSGREVGRKTLTVSQILELSSAIKLAHNGNLFHGDLHCGNILLTESGHVKVIDFGYATSDPCSRAIDIAKVQSFRPLDMSESEFHQLTNL